MAIALENNQGNAFENYTLQSCQLPWRYPGATLTFNGAPGNIMGNFDRYDIENQWVKSAWPLPSVPPIPH